MPISESSLRENVKNVLDTKFEISSVTKIPNVSDSSPTLNGNDGDSFYASVLFIDLRGSTNLFQKHYDNGIAKILMSYYKGITEIATDNSGHIRSFNGDSLLVFFYGDTKKAVNDSVRCAMKISYFINNILNPELENKKFSKIDFGIGIDHGNILSVKVGKKKSEGADNKDLIWIAEAVNFSAKMSDNGSNPYHIYISNKIYINLDDKTKYSTKTDIYGSTSKIEMWNSKSITFSGEYKNVYNTSYHWSIN